MREVIKLYKKLGETPLECLERFRLEKDKYKNENMTYLGRLDPMAEGLLLVLVGDTRNKEEYLNLSKTYEFEVLWDFETDTYDILGLPLEKSGTRARIDEKSVTRVMSHIMKKKTQSYPPFSSKAFKGNYLTAREGRIDGFDIPERNIKIFSLDHIHTRLASYEELLKEITQRISLVKGDFRQKEIMERWQEVLKSGGGSFVSKFHADVSSGTYIRSLAHEMGKELGTSAIAYSIKRTRVGEYRLES